MMQHSSVNMYGLVVYAALLCCFQQVTSAQSGPFCSLLGPVFPAPINAVYKPGPISCAVSKLQGDIKALLQDSFKTSNVSFHISAFTTDANLFNLSYAAPGLNGSLTGDTLDENTVYRIGSVSKLLTVYTLLAEVGVEHMHDPVTKWVPELAAYAESHSGNTSSITTANWSQITVGALASHMAGISRDLSLQDLSLFYNDTITKLVGIPKLAPSDIPSCGTSNILPPCNRSAIFAGLNTLHPVTASSSTPIYSNIAFQILMYALEGMTNRTFTQSFETRLVGALDLSSTTLEAPTESSNAIIPEDETVSWWSTKTGDASSFGGMFSTGSDLAKIGQSILSSSLLGSDVTRAWLKPLTGTADSHISVGMPWEIRRMELPLSSSSNETSSGTRIVDLYTKNGVLGSYSSYFVLSPDHGFGYSVLLASTVAESATRNTVAALLTELVADTLVPVFETEARIQAQTNYAGTYNSIDADNVTSTLSISTEDGKPGLGVTTWMRDDVDVLQTFAVVSGIPVEYVPSLRLYPMAPEDDGQKAFRGVYEALPSSGGMNGTASASSDGIFTSGCLSWGAVDTPQYGNIGFDDFVFDIGEDGRATAITPRVVRTRFQKQI